MDNVHLTPCAFLSDMFRKKNFEVKIAFLYNIGGNHYVLQIFKNTFQRMFTEYIWQLFLFLCISCHTGRKYEILIQCWLVVDKNIIFLQYANHIFKSYEKGQINQCQIFIYESNLVFFRNLTTCYFTLQYSW